MAAQMPPADTPKERRTTYQKSRDALDVLIELERRTSELAITGKVELILDQAEGTTILAARRAKAEQELRSLGWVPPSPTSTQKQRLRDHDPDPAPADSLAAARAAAADPTDPCADARRDPQ